MSAAISKNQSGVFQEPVVVKILSGEHFTNESVIALAKVAESFFASLEIQHLKEQELHFQELGAKKILLILPGATDLKAIALTHEQQEQINCYALSGSIKVLAVCAGAFFASKTISYNGNIRHADKKLTLFKGASCGPAFPSEDPRWKLSAEEISLEQFDEQRQGFAAMIGGGFFVPDSKLTENKDYTIVSRYLTLPSKPIAALTCVPGEEKQFHVALIGPHAEFEGDDESFKALKIGFSDKAHQIDQITHDLRTTTRFRKELFYQVFSRLGFK